MSGRTVDERNKRLRVGVPAVVVRPGRNGGGEVALRQIIRELQREPALELVVFVDPLALPLFSRSSNTRFVSVKVPNGRLRRVARIAWENTLLRLAPRRFGLDVVLFPANLVPAAFPAPAVVLTYDFSSIFYREQFPDMQFPLSQRLLDFERVRSCKRANAVVASSQFTAREIMRITGVEAGKIRTIPLGVRQFEPVNDRVRKGVLEKLGIDKPFMLAVASLAPHKNLERLVDAFAARAGSDLTGYQLVLAGQSGGADDAIYQAVKRHGLGDRIVVPGFVSDEELGVLYQEAEVFVLPSLYEGFGLPVLEAAAYGTAVAAGRAGSLPEVTGEAGILFDPTNVEEMADALGRLALSPDLRARLGSQGRRWAARFSWQQAAANIAEVLTEVASQDSLSTDTKLGQNNA